jgi:hypothetical protein
MGLLGKIRASNLSLPIGRQSVQARRHRGRRPLKHPTTLFTKGERGRQAV